MVLEEKNNVSFENVPVPQVEQQQNSVERGKEQSTEAIPQPNDEAAVRAQMEKQEQLQKTQAATNPQSEEYESDTFKIIEQILEEDLGYIYEDLPPYMQKDFREKGAKTAHEIELLMRKVKVNVRKIIKLIVGWLRIIPGINSFYLEQEAKIKADKILLELHKK